MILAEARLFFSHNPSGETSQMHAPTEDRQPSCSLPISRLVQFRCEAGILRRSRHGSEAQSQYIGGAAGAASRPHQIAKGRQVDGLSYGASKVMDHFTPQSKIQIPRNLMIALVAGGGFVPQSYIDSVQLTDSTIVPNAKKGYKGKSFIQFSFSSCFHRSTRILSWAHFCTVRLERYRCERAHTRL